MIAEGYSMKKTQNLMINISQKELTISSKRDLVNRQRSHVITTFPSLFEDFFKTWETSV